MTNEKTMDKDSIIKPTFDGRVAYYNTIEIFLKAFAESKIQSDLHSQLRAYTGLFLMMSPYIKKKESEEIRKDLDKIQGLLESDNKVMVKNSSKLLNTIGMKLFDYGKHLMLPVSSEDLTQEVNWDEI